MMNLGGCGSMRVGRGETHESQDSRSCGRDSNPEFPEYEPLNRDLRSIT
jgi:hypothetical protein